MAVSLVIMAAGLGSRYGGSKQVDGIGPNGEILMEYSIHDALRAGFDKVVFIIKPEMREMMDELVGYLKEKKTAKGQPVQVAYVYQDYTSVPDFYHIPEGRTKPFGTVHALLCAERRWTDPSASSTPMTTMEKKASKKSMSSSFPNSRKTAGLTTAWQASSSEIP